MEGDKENESQRLFIALPLPELIKEEIGERMKAMRQKLPFQRWVHPSDLHITVQFLGDVQTERITALHEALQQSMLPLSAFEVEIHGLGVFGRSDKPSVLWAGIETDAELLAALHRSVIESTQPLGFEPETRPYRPHLTLARRYEGSDAASELKEAVACMTGNEWSWMADHIMLYKSKFGSQPMYEAIGRYCMKD
ncbi:RNA 2',3'-cyclic phosphodiesterase [Paenibacillus kobensis]|uniref:RNA 2',3'-cyclic phosphodiesterase n=1 Tax=Paenibacillus kobensis TaxID=59841 RepID=UPI0013E2D50D|nr:RNA 2',3'-cyclic phosphodiesterase [Paenibacillus kobensis]